MSKLAKYLNQHIVGNVFDRPTILQAYATDRSILQTTPRLVALPKNSEDVRKLVRFSSQLAERGFSLPITVRGTGRDKTGAAIGDGLVISLEQLNRIEEIDLRGRLVRVQPGITLGKLNTALGSQGFTLPIEYDPETTLGGLIANCPTDNISNKYGGIYHYVERVEAVLASGDLVQFAPYGTHAVMARASQTNAEGELYRSLEQILDRHADTILDRSTRPFDAAGYANVTKVRQGHTMNLLPLMFASQGTLSIITDVILRVEVANRYLRRLMLVVRDLKLAERILDQVSNADARSIKIYDLRIVQHASEAGRRPNFFDHDFQPQPNAEDDAAYIDDKRDKLPLAEPSRNESSFINTSHEGLLIIASFDDRKHRTLRKIQQIIATLPANVESLAENDYNTNDFTEVETMLTSYLNDNLIGERTPVLDDVYIPRFKTTEYLQGVRTISEILGQDLLVFGSFLTSNYHVRPEFDCSSMDGRRLIMQFLRLYNNLVKDLGGSLTGGSPEGRVKAIASAGALSDREKTLYQDIKNAFDPHNILNPEVKLGADLKSTIRKIRTEPQLGVTGV